MYSKSKTSSTKQKSSIRTKKQSTSTTESCLRANSRINYFRHFLDTLRNYNPMDDEPMWDADRVVALTPGFAITIPKTTNKFAIKDTFMDLKSKLKTTTKNYQASIQNLEDKFDKFADKQSGRPSGSLISNTQPNPKAENMLVEFGKFTFPADFVILEMEEDSKVPLILGRPFLNTADVVIQVKQKQLNLGVGTE
ncbi:reverse transcriptase domain-containing protein [Tanacetum coccineum]|uniref:Reverse transcriptase domain-containing protein n=1 Tax=Tanacetum coccineum TaxID=301880 RepID=A0ABQ5EGB0_9ASTR